MEEKTTPQAHPAGGPSVPPHSSKLKSLLKNKKLLIISGVVAVLLLAAAMFFLTKGEKNQPVTNSEQQNNNQQNSDTQQSTLDQDDAFVRENLQGCKDREISFTHAPVPLDQMGYIEPMGKTNDGHVTPTDHVYISPINSSAADNTYDVVMPADGTVTVVSAMPAQYVGDSNQQTAPEDHRLVIAHNCQYASIFIHVHKLSDALRSAVDGTLEPNTSKQVAIELKAGDKLGKIGGNPVDWSLMDAKQTLKGFITPSLYARESWKIHVIDPIAIYTGSMKDQLIAKSLRSVEPYGGKIDYDKKGALVGNWFKEGTNGYEGTDMSRYWDGHLSIAPNYIDPSATTVSLGNWQGKAAQFTAKTGSPDPATITVSSGVVKYELVASGYQTATGQSWNMGFAKGIKAVQTGTVKGTVLVQVQDGEKLKVELFPGKSASQVSSFTSAAQTYIR